MIYKTFAQIRSKVERELDIEVEEFIQPEEFIEYVNDAVAMAEAEIHKLGLEDEYFLTKFNIPLTVNQEDYTLPAPIYMNKIRAFTYTNGTTIYTINRLRGLDRFLEIELINQYKSSTDYYQYLLRNDTANGGVVLQLVPPSRESSATHAKMWYIRECAKWATTDVNGAGLCDLPQIAMQFLYQYIKFRCYEKEGHPNTSDAKIDLGTIRTTMISTMEQMVPDDDNEVLKDMSHYEDMS